MENEHSPMISNDEIDKLIYPRGQGKKAVSQAQRDVSDTYWQGRIAGLEARIASMKADRLTYCAYCGEEFSIDSGGTPEAVSNHIHNCLNHPIQDYKAEIERLKVQIAKPNTNISSVCTGEGRME